MVHGLKCLESREDEVKSVKREPSDTAMGWPTGFEPATAGTTIRGSTVELRPPFFLGESKTSASWNSAKQIFGPRIPARAGEFHRSVPLW